MTKAERGRSADDTTREIALSTIALQEASKRSVLKLRDLGDRAASDWFSNLESELFRCGSKRVSAGLPSWMSPQLIVSITMLQEAVKCALLRLCDKQGVAATADWLTDLECELIHSLKNTVTARVAMPDEVAMVDNASRRLRVIFAGVRRAIADKSKGATRE